MRGKKGFVVGAPVFEVVETGTDVFELCVMRP